MTKNDKRVQMLSNQLHHVGEDLLIDLAHHYNDVQWGGNVNMREDGGCYFECDVAVGECIEEYQVYRKFGIGVVDNIEYDYKGEHHVGMDETYDEHYEEFEDTIEPTTEVDWLIEFGQIWMNTITGQITHLTRTNENMQIQDNATLHVTDGKYIGRNFFGDVADCSIIGDALADESYLEISVHPTITKFGHKQFDTFSYEMEKDNTYYGENIIDEWRKAIGVSAMVIARRHGYTQYDTDMYREYINLLMWKGMDIRNPKNILPADLQAEFDRLQAEKQEQDRRKQERIERARREELERRAKADMEKLAETLADNGECNMLYQQKMKNMLGIEIVGGGFIAMPLHNVKEFYEEGTNMHHCVFRGGYYKKFTSLILSVRDESGNRLATVEYNINTQTIVQCYAQNDKIPEKDSEIRKFIMENLPKQLRLAA